MIRCHHYDKSLCGNVYIFFMLVYIFYVSLAPDHSVSHNNLGSLLAGKEAEFHFRQAVLHNPRHYKAYFNLGNNLQ